MASAPLECGQSMIKADHSLGRRVWHSAMVFGTLSTLVRVGANILLLPLVLSYLTTAELALWWVFFALGAVANLADFGFGQAITRAYSYLWAGIADFSTEGLAQPPAGAEPNFKRIHDLNATARHLYLRLALGAGLLLCLGGSWLIQRPAQQAATPWVVWLSWAAYIVVVGYSLATSHWLLGCQGINRVRDQQAAYFWGGLAYVGTAAVLLAVGAGLLAMVVATGARGWVSRQIAAHAFRKALQRPTLEAVKPDRDMLRRLWPNVWKFGILSTGTYLIYNATVLISSRVLGDAITASYGLTAQVGLFLANFSALWLAVKWPQLTILRTQGQTQAMAILFARRLAAMIATFSVLATIVWFAGNALLAWKGTHTQLLPALPLAVYLFYVGQQQVYIQFANLKFTENVVPFYYVSLFTGLAMCLLTWWMSRWLGLWGLVLATAACSSWYPVWRAFVGQPLTVKQFFRVAMGGAP